MTENLDHAGDDVADPTRYPESGADAGAAPERAPMTGTPLWVWIVGIVVLGTSLAMVVSMTVPLLMGGMGGGGH